jgi:hypothetical protein
MAFSTALTSDQLESLRGTSALAPAYAGSVYLSIVPQTIVFRALVNQVSFAASYAEVIFDTVTTGAFGDIVPGMTVYISPATDLNKAVFIGRAREAATSTILKVNETSATIANNYVITVVDDYRIWDKLGRMVSGVLKHDYEIAFRQLLPFVYGIKSAYADWIDTVTDVYQIAFAPLAVAATSGATISTWAWDVGDGTITVGSASTQNITATFPEGFRWVYLTVTDSGSRAITRKIPVWAHGDTYAPELINSGSLNVTAIVGSGNDATVTAFAGVDSILDNTQICAWSAEEIYQDFDGSLVGDNIAFVGRIRKHTDTTRTEAQSAIDSERQYTIEGALTQLARIEQLPYEMLNKAASPTLFGQIVNMTLWRGIVYLLSECSTFLELHSLYFDDTTNDYLAPTRNPVGNILNAINDLAGSINSALQMNYSGQAEIVLDLRMATTAQRTAAVTVAPWDQSDILDIQLDHSHVRTVGRLKASGGAYNSVSNLYATYESLAPGVAQDYPEGTSSLDKQVLRANQAGAVAQLELNIRAGHAFERAQEVDSLTVLFADGYHSVLIPALNQWHTFTVSDTEINIVLDTTTRWLLTEVNTTHNSAEGTKEVRAVFTKETSGAPGQTVVYPVVAEVPLLEPTFPPFEPYPVFPIDIGDIIGTDPIIDPIVFQDQVPNNGNAIVVGTANQLLVVINAMLTSTPGTRDVTPADMIGIPYDGRLGAGKDFYLLTYDGSTNESYVYYTEDVFAGEPIWVLSAAIAGKHTELVTTATQGEVYAYSPGLGASACSTLTYDLTTDAMTGWGSALALTYVPLATWRNSSHWNDPAASASYTRQGGTGAWLTSGYASTQQGFVGGFDLGQECIVDTISINTNGGASQASRVVILYLFNAAGTQTGHAFLDTTGGGVVNDTQAFNATAQYVIVGMYAQNQMTATDLEITFAATSDAQTVFSDDFAATWGTPEVLGDSPGAWGGLDTSKIGSQVLASADGQTYKAATGGAAAAYGTAHSQGAYFIPRYIFTSSSSGNTGSTPEYLLFAPALDTGASMWRVDTSGTVFTDITPIRSAVEALAVSHRSCAMYWRSGEKIIAIGEFGGAVRRLCTSDDSGATWKFSAVLDDDALALTTRKTDIACKQVFIANSEQLTICFDAFAATPLLSHRNLGLTDVLLFVEVYAAG